MTTSRCVPGMVTACFRQGPLWALHHPTCSTSAGKDATRKWQSWASRPRGNAEPVFFPLTHTCLKNASGGV